MNDPLELEYDEIASDFGRRIANRWLIARQYEQGHRDFTRADFVAAFGPEDGLPEHERTRAEDIFMFRDIGMMLFNHDVCTLAPIIAAARKVPGCSKDWPKEIAEFAAACESDEQWSFNIWLFGRMFLSSDARALLEKPGFESWAKEFNEMNDSDAFALWLILFGKFPRPDASKGGGSLEAAIAAEYLKTINPLPDMTERHQEEATA